MQPEDHLAPKGDAEGRLAQALLTIDHLTRQGQRSSQETESLLNGIKVLLEARTVESLQRGILDVLSMAVPFEAANILTLDANNRLYSQLSSNSDLHFNGHPADRVFLRALNGETVVLVNLRSVSEWPSAEQFSGKQWASAMLVPLQWGVHRAILICAHSTRATFNQDHARFARMFAPVACQAMSQAEAMQHLESLVKELDYRANHDEMTRLANRSLFNNVLKACCESESSAPFGVVMFDLDHFKLINDTLGHAAGDTLLCTLADRLQDELFADHCVARFGGDEFAIIVSEIDGEPELMEICNRLMELLSPPVMIKGTKILPRMSVGAMAVTPGAYTPDVALMNVDLALYEAKARGRHQICMFHHSLRDQRDKMHALDRAMRIGLKADEFSLSYHPIVNTPTGAHVGVEVLLRWTSANFGGIPPDIFIPIAEDTGFISILGDWVIRRAFTEAGDWLREAAGQRRMAINIAERQLRDAGFASRLSSFVEQWDLSPQWIELELSESLAADSETGILSKNLLTLKNMGFQIAFDDFGTGNTSIDKLRMLPGDRVKIDQSFVENIIKRSDDYEVVRGMIDLAHGLNLKVVAEGVETFDQAQLLNDLGCDEIQGHLNGEPMPFEEYLTLADETFALMKDQPSLASVG